jgi:hypothetical protein
MREILSTWREAIETELGTARADLGAAIEAVTTAEVEVAVARRSRRGLGDAVARLGPNRAIAGALSWRVREHDAALGQVDGKLVRAKNEVKNCRARIADLEDALSQIERMAEPQIIEVAA